MAPELLSAKRKQRLTHARSRVNTTHKQAAAAGGSGLPAPVQHVCSV